MRSACSGTRAAHWSSRRSGGQRPGRNLPPASAVSHVRWMESRRPDHLRRARRSLISRAVAAGPLPCTEIAPGCRMRVVRIDVRPWSSLMHTYAQPRRPHERLAAGLGWFSLALGTAEVVAPRRMARLIGIPDDPRLVNVIRTFGAREIASGLGLLAQPAHAGWAWSRVGGDAIDLAFLGSAANEDTANHHRVAMAAGAVAGVAALDLICARGLQDRRGGERTF